MRAVFPGSVALAAVTLGIALAGQTPTPAPAQALTPGPILLTGRVVEAGTTAGVPHATVWLSGSALGSGSVPFSDGTPGGLRRLIADADGWFLFRALPPGSYDLSAMAAGFVSGGYGMTRLQQAQRRLEPERRLELVETENRVTVTVSLWKTGGVSGVVLDEADEPMAGVQVTMLSRVPGWGGLATYPGVALMTDDRGRYHADVTPGDYLVALLAATTTVPAAAADDFQRARNEGPEAQRAFLAGIGASGGLLPRGYGTRIDQFVVSQFGSRNAPVVPPIVERDGRLQFYPSTYHPSGTTIASAAVVSVAPGEEKSGVDIRMRPLPVVRVSGRLLGPAGPAPAVAVQLFASDPTLARESPTRSIDTPQAFADGRGDFTFIGVAPGAYTLRVLQQPRADADALLWAADPITVGDSDLVGLEVKLQTGVRISGRLAVDGTGPPPALAALRAITILPRAVPGSAAALVGTTTPDRVDDSLRFTTRLVAPGPYRIAIAGLPRGWVVRSVSAGAQNLVDRTFDLGATGLTDVIITISDRTSSLSGVARDAAGAPASTAAVVVFPTDRTLWRELGLAGRLVKAAAPARNGGFTIRGLPAGDYFLAAVDWPAADFSDPQTLADVSASASRVTIRDGGSVTQDLRVTIVR